MQTPIPPLDERPPIHYVEDHVIPTEEYDIPIRIYTPEGEGPFPLFVFFHGGGWVAGNLETHDVNCRQIAIESGYKVIAVDYRLAPKHPFPAAPNDCYAATKWVVEHARELKGNLNQIAVGGPSAGGNLAAAVTLMARDRREFAISKQVLIYPATDSAENEASYLSLKEYAHGYGMSLHAQNPYLKEQGDANHPYASPIKAKDLRGLPPALVLTAECDPLRDEGEEYAVRLLKAGVPVECKRFNGTIHGFMYHFSDLDDYKEGFRLVGLFLKK
ncbi:alpha/beta hydrolase [Priestia filamentosa]|uniref:alpha/beta hydrolase n=1 Tax=Priestia filamentosa TaxID=1402861 RepID=UPI00385770A1